VRATHRAGRVFQDLKTTMTNPRRRFKRPCVLPDGTRVTVSINGYDLKALQSGVPKDVQNAVLACIHELRLKHKRKKLRRLTVRKLVNAWRLDQWTPGARGAGTPLATVDISQQQTRAFSPMS
jgi:hypothetical protein